MQIVFTADGRAHCVYDETLDLAELGQLRIARASHVEPNPEGRWLADLSPVGGPVLGPYAQRSQALAAERNWLAAHWIARPNSPS